MTDIVERLRLSVTKGHEPTDEDAIEAADEIERLRTRLAIQFGMHPGGDLAKAAQAEIERLRAALEPFARNPDATSLGEALGHIVREHLQNARRALEPKP